LVTLSLSHLDLAWACPPLALLSSPSLLLPLLSPTPPLREMHPPSSPVPVDDEPKEEEDEGLINWLVKVMNIVGT